MNKKLSMLFFILILNTILKCDIVEAEVINIFAEPNGTAKEVDFKILEEELSFLGHDVRFFNVNSKTSIWWSASFDRVDNADINIFIEKINLSLFHFGKLNFLIPNPKIDYDPNVLMHFDLILCQTIEQERIFENLNQLTYFLGFTSFDRYRRHIPKDFQKCIHLNGRSPNKGTKTILDVWTKHSEFPLLINLSKNENGIADPKRANVKFINQYIPEDQLIDLQNRCGIHVCTSEMEGYGHSIMEGMSAGAVVVTTDAPPMNLFIIDQRCLVEYNKFSFLNHGTCYYIDPKSLENVISNLMSLPRTELEKIGRKNRDYYLQEKEIFRERLKKLFGKINY